MEVLYRYISNGEVFTVIPLSFYPFSSNVEVLYRYASKGEVFTVIPLRFYPFSSNVDVLYRYTSNGEVFTIIALIRRFLPFKETRCSIPEHVKSR